MLGRLGGLIGLVLVLAASCFAQLDIDCLNACHTDDWWNNEPVLFCADGHTYENQLCNTSLLMTAHCMVQYEHKTVESGTCACPGNCLFQTINGACSSLGCNCRLGYTGVDCSQISCIEGNQCNGRGECQEVEGVQTCVCEDGRAGNDCSINLVDLPPFPQIYPSTQYSDADKYGEEHPAFNKSTVAEVHIFLDPADLEFLLDPDNLSTKEYMNATFWFYNGQTLERRDEVGFRLKGGFTRTSTKKTWKVKFNEFNKGSDWKQLKKLTFKGLTTDPSVVREIFSSEGGYSMNVPIPRVAYARMNINRRYFGLYAITEQLDDKYVKSRYGNKDGSLWKVRGAIEYIGPEPDAYATAECGGRLCYDPKTDAAEEDYTPIRDLSEVLYKVPDEEFEERINEVLDVELFARTLAWEVMFGQWDGIHNGNNYYLFYNPASGLVEYIRYDLDVAFGVLLNSHRINDSSIYEWGKDEDGVIITRMLQLESFVERYEDHILNMIDSGFNGREDDRWVGRYKAMQEQIATPLAQDSWWGLDSGYTFNQFLTSFNTTIDRGPFPPYKARTIVTGISEFIEARVSTALEQIAERRAQRAVAH